MKNLLIHSIPPEVVSNMYWEEKKSPSEIAKILGCCSNTVRNFMIKNGIRLRSLSEANTIVANNPETQRKRRLKLCGRPSGVLGKTWKHSPESRIMRSKRFRGDKNPNWKGGRTKDINIQRQYRVDHKALRRNGSKAMPLWASKEKISAIYKEAREKGLTVDHIIPLTHPLVCGLHCETNLQLLSKSDNSSKNNSFAPFFGFGCK